MKHEPVAHAVDERSIGRLPSGIEITVPVHRYAGGSGPTVHVQAVQHGIELNGPAALRRLHERLLGAEIAGTVVVVPVVNPLAFDHRSYATPTAYDARNPNLNRVWPGDDAGSLQERMAADLWELVRAADAVVDLHTGNPDMLEHVRYHEGDDDGRALAEAFGTRHLLADDDGDAVADESFSGRLRTAASRVGIPAITAELENSRRVERESAERGVDGLENVLRSLDVLAASAIDHPPATTLRDGVPYTVADASGLYERAPGVDVGDHVSEGEVIGRIYDPTAFEVLDTVTAAGSGVAYSLRRGSVAVAGERLAALARPV